MSMFNKKQGKHSPGSVDEDATVALSDKTKKAGADEPTQAIASDSAPTVASTAVMPSAQGGVPQVKDEALAGFDIDSAGYPLNAPAAPQDSYVKASSSNPAKSRKRAVKAFFITFAILACILVAVYVGVAMKFTSSFMPNTQIDGRDISMMSDEEALQVIDQIPGDYRIDVLGGTFSLRMTGEDLGMKLDSQALIQAMHDDQDAWRWPWYLFEAGHDETFLLKTTYDEKACNSLVKAAVKKFNKTAKKPVDASIAFDEGSQTFTIKPEEIGTQLKASAVQDAVKAAVADMQPKVELTDEQLKQPKLLSTDKKLAESAEIANGLVSAHLKLMVEGDVVDEIGSEQLSGFIKIKDTFNVSLDEDALASWVDNLAASYDTVGMERTYTRADGKVITVRGGTYGWEIDKETLRANIMDAIKAGKKTEIDVPCIDSANLFARQGERDWGNRYIDVDISEQHVRFYGNDGKIIWEADCISGVPDGKHDTTQGVWYVIMKQSPSKLIGYTEDGKKDYETTVTYWMPFIGNSIGFHDANWQPSFGGEMYAQGYGSHGCVNLDPSDAKELYGIIEPNDVVVVHS